MCDQWQCALIVAAHICFLQRLVIWTLSSHFCGLEQIFCPCGMWCHESIWWRDWSRNFLNVSFEVTEIFMFVLWLEIYVVIYFQFDVFLWHKADDLLLNLGSEVLQQYFFISVGWMFVCCPFSISSCCLSLCLLMSYVFCCGAHISVAFCQLFWLQEWGVLLSCQCCAGLVIVVLTVEASW